MATVSQQEQSSGVSVLPLIVFGVLSLIFGFVMWLVLPYLGVLPVAASQEANNTDALFRVLLGIGGVVFFLVQGLVYYAAIAFRARANDNSDGPNFHGNMLLEIVWTIVPAVIVVFLAIYAYIVWNTNTAVTASPNSVNGESIGINVYGQRFAWTFEYITNARESVQNPDGSISEGAGDRVVVTTGDLYVYAGQEVYLQMETRDVIHAFWSPEMRIKQDLLPGRVTEVRFRPIDPNVGWNAVMLVSPFQVYAAADLSSEVVLDIQDTPTDFGPLAASVPFDLVDPYASFTPAEGQSVAFVEVKLPEGGTGFIPVSADTEIARFNRYRLICAELCGSGHGDMYRHIFMFESQEGFETTWYDPIVAVNSQPAGNPIAYGERIISAYGCAGCHVLDSLGWASQVGPSLNGIGANAANRTQDATDQSGNEITSGAEYLAQSLRNPHAYLRPGYGAVMRVFGSGANPPAGVAVSLYSPMPQEDLIGIVAFLCTQTGSDPASSTCGLQNWEFDSEGRFAGDTGALVEELTLITDEYEN